MYEHHGAGALDYFPCRYGKSKLLFRGPKRRLDRPYCAMLGGTETYGKYVQDPFSVLVEQATGVRAINLGCPNAGLDAFVGDDAIMEVCAAAKVTVVQVLGAQNLSNRFYSVHPRRNDRFLAASAMLRSVYREVDFTEFHFTRHMLSTLHEVSAERFELVRDELKLVWVRRMRDLAGRLPDKSVLLWLSEHAPRPLDGPSLGHDPLFVDKSMVDAVSQLFRTTVEVVVEEDGVEGMVFPPLEQPAAARTPGPGVHAQVAQALGPVVRAMM